MEKIIKDIINNKGHKICYTIYIINSFNDVYYISLENGAFKFNKEITIVEGNDISKIQKSMRKILPEVRLLIDKIYIDIDNKYVRSCVYDSNNYKKKEE